MSEGYTKNSLHVDEQATSLWQRNPIIYVMLFKLASDLSYLNFQTNHNTNKELKIEKIKPMKKDF